MPRCRETIPRGLAAASSDLSKCLGNSRMSHMHIPPKSARGAPSFRTEGKARLPCKGKTWQAAA